MDETTVAEFVAGLLLAVALAALSYIVGWAKGHGDTVEATVESMRMLAECLHSDRQLLEITEGCEHLAKLDLDVYDRLLLSRCLQAMAKDVLDADKLKE